LEPDDEQRQDVFDPSGSAKWIDHKLGGFDFGQNAVSIKEASKKEMREKKEQDHAIKMISNSFAISDAIESTSKWGSNE
jgi:hypothetical protein